MAGLAGAVGSMDGTHVSCHKTCCNQATVPNAKTGSLENNMPFNSDSWSKIVGKGLEKYLDPVEEASFGTGMIPSLDHEWPSDDELPPQWEHPPPLPTTQMPKVPEEKVEDIVHKVQMFQRFHTIHLPLQRERSSLSSSS
ncbi:hypothetical protein IV203_005345 [Nitzschia inconspicua]|uniref:Uncharacterized protein n=1 Tax=Nitzschia inconspicua TaxID=303405 RepID=A0A9K3KM18_9STRA|nr:hypothetical protein IV203_005345 [Nitzschia inconspicua]